MKVSKAFRVDFKLLDVEKVIVLKGKDQINSKSNEWLGLYGMKHRFLSKKLRGIELVMVDVEKWKAMKEEEQYNFLYQLSRFKDS